MNAFRQSVLRAAAVLAVATAAFAWSLPAHAETIAGALAKALLRGRGGDSFLDTGDIVAAGPRMHATILDVTRSAF